MITIPETLEKALDIEGSELRIQSGSIHNMDWNWKVGYANGRTGRWTDYIGDDLQDSLDHLADRVVAIDG